MDINQIDQGSAALISLGSLFAGAAGGYLQTNWIASVVFAVVAIACFVTREFIKE